ncbi:MAG: trypsin-like peptidase domain-containing protein [Pirellulaceae bacterium]|nr:trypsin-like peptidase domain-containing protein [Pirellulaceae bacterium]
MRSFTIFSLVLLTFCFEGLSTTLWAQAVGPVTTSAPPRVVMLDFYSDFCGPCQTMGPVVGRLQQSGYAVEKINIDRQADLAARFQITSVPAYVFLVDGKEVSRTGGLLRYADLQNVFEQIQNQFVKTTSQFQNNLPNDSPENGQLLSRQEEAASSSAALLPKISSAQARQRAMAATVRLRVDDPDGYSFGTGTIIGYSANKALVITCGHLFRDSQGLGKITVELFKSGSSQGRGYGDVVRRHSGQVLEYNAPDFRNADAPDIALVIFTVDSPVTTVPVSWPGLTMQKGEGVFSIGCNKGEAPTIMQGHVTAINKFEGPDNIEASGVPVDGRSGGGLFNEQGVLIGVCNAANPEDQEGMYAAAKVIQWQLAKHNLETLYQSPLPNYEKNGLGNGLSRTAIAANTTDRSTSANAMVVRGQSNPIVPVKFQTKANTQVQQGIYVASFDYTNAASRQTLSQYALNRQKIGGQNIVQATNSRVAGPHTTSRPVEVRRQLPNGQEEVIILQNPSSDLLYRLRQEGTIQRR